jgi:chemotaxis protein MotB
MMISRCAQCIAFAIAALVLVGCSNQRHARSLADCRGELSNARNALTEATSREREAQSREREAQSARVQAQELASNFQSIATKLRESFTAGELELELQHGVLVMTLEDDILFDFGETKISPRGEDALYAAASALKNISISEEKMMLVFGHTDNTPVKPGTREYASNIELSAKRSLAVHSHLISLGVPARMLGVAGIGAMRPTASNETASGRSQNRRIEIIMLPTIDSLPDLPTAE